MFELMELKEFLLGALVMSDIVLALFFLRLVLCAWNRESSGVGRRFREFRIRTACLSHTISLLCDDRGRDSR